jgi:WD40 repeat protein
VFGVAPLQLQAQRIEPNAEAAYDLDWRPNDTVLAVAGEGHVWLLDEHFQVLDAYTYPLAPDGMAHQPKTVEWSPDGSWLATIHWGGWLRVWSYPDGTEVFNGELTEREDPDTIRWHPTEPLLSTYRQVVNVQTGTVEQPFPVDIYVGSDFPVEQDVTGKVFWSPDGTRLIRSIGEAGCSPCSEYGLFDTASGALIQSLGVRSGAWDGFIWSVDGRYRVIDHVLINDLLFDSQIERMVYVETGAFEWSRMPAIFVINTFGNQDVVNHQVVYPISLLRIDWTPDTLYGVTALNCNGEILSIDIRDMSISAPVSVFAPYPLNTDSPCQNSVFPGYTNP